MAVTALATAGLLTATSYTPTSGVLIDERSGVVESVEPAGYAWRDGIRPGQRIIAVAAADEPGGWRLETVDGDGLVRVSSGASIEAAVRRTAILGAFALLFALLGFLLRGGGSPAAGGVLGLGAALAGVPLAASGDPLLAAAGIVVAAVFVSASLVVEIDGSRSDITALLFPVAAACGVAAVVIGVGSDLLWAITAAGVLAGLARWSASWARGRPLRTPRDRGPGALVTLSVVVPIGALAVASWWGWIPWFVATGLAVLVVAAVRPARAALAHLLDRAWLDDVRRTATVVAIDDERSRVASDLHDAPLQEIAGVLARLELVPDVEAERDALRIASQHIRDVVTGLQPPMLEPLGLRASIEHLAAQARSDPAAPTVLVAIDCGPGRPPLPVEVAAYRIAEEALRNAVRHSRATQVEIEGEISEASLRLWIADDGVGCDVARPGGGMTSMPVRARSVGGRFTRAAGPVGGTAIGFDWPST